MRQAIRNIFSHHARMADYAIVLAVLVFVVSNIYGQFIGQQTLRKVQHQASDAKKSSEVNQTILRELRAAIATGGSTPVSVASCHFLRQWVIDQGHKPIFSCPDPAAFQEP